MSSGQVLIIDDENKLRDLLKKTTSIRKQASVLSCT